MFQLKHAGRRLVGLGVAAVALLVIWPSMASAADFHFQEATVTSIHAAFASGQLTCSQLTQLYLDRIEAYNMKGPALFQIEIKKKASG